MKNSRPLPRRSASLPANGLSTKAVTLKRRWRNRRHRPAPSGPAANNGTVGIIARSRRSTPTRRGSAPRSRGDQAPSPSTGWCTTSTTVSARSSGGSVVLRTARPWQLGLCVTTDTHAIGGALIQSLENLAARVTAVAPHSTHETAGRGGARCCHAAWTSAQARSSIRTDCDLRAPGSCGRAWFACACPLGGRRLGLGRCRLAWVRGAECGEDCG